MKEIAPKDFTYNPFESIGHEWMLIAAARNGQTNAMTASWGGWGVLWDFDVVYIFVRQSRYTKEFLDGSETFSLTFFPPSEHKNLAYFGCTSGRDEDKIAKVGYHVAMDHETPYFEEARAALLCTKLSAHPITMDSMPQHVKDRWYANGDPHDLYIGRLDKILVKE